MKKTIAVTVEDVRERYTLLNKGIALKIYVLKKDSNKAWISQVFVVVFFSWEKTSYSE